MPIISGPSANPIPGVRPSPSNPAHVSASNHSFTTNIAYDAEGQDDTRPGTWGKAAFVDSHIPFINVPAGYRVRLLRGYGDHVAWPHGTPAANTYAGVLFGILANLSGGSPYVGPGLGSAGCPLYIQNKVPGEARAFDFVFPLESSLVGADNVMILRQAVFLNETGVSIHMEATITIEFRYEQI